MKKIVSIFFAGLFLMACSGEVEKVVEEAYPDGSPKLVRYYLIGNADKGFVKEMAYYPGGQVRYEGQFQEGKRHGKWVYYYENGKKWSEGYFKEGKRDDSGITWHENGNISIKGKYCNGLRVGKWQFYSPEGELLKEVEYGE